LAIMAVAMIEKMRAPVAIGATDVELKEMRADDLPPALTVNRESERRLRRLPTRMARGPNAGRNCEPKRSMTRAFKNQNRKDKPSKICQIRGSRPGINRFELLYK